VAAQTRVGSKRGAAGFVTELRSSAGADNARESGEHELQRALPSFVAEFEQRLHGLCNAGRTLPALTAENAHEERARLIASLLRGEALVPRFALSVRPVPRAAFRLIDELRRQVPELVEVLANAAQAPSSPCSEERAGTPFFGAVAERLYREKLDEVELDLMLLDALGRPRAVRTLAARRYGTGARMVTTEHGEVSLAGCARVLLDRVEPDSEPKVLAADGTPDSLGNLVRALAGSIGLAIEVRVEPRLASGAAAGEHTVFLAARRFGRVEAQRLAVHEVLGHLVAAHNGRKQALRIFEWGTAESFADQEGVALYLEAKHGVMDATRMRVLAGRVVATDMMHAGASFSETAHTLHRLESFSPIEAIGMAERAYRGGGVARDASYLLGYLRVQHAIGSGAVTLDELRAGRLSVTAVPAMRALAAAGYGSTELLRPNFSRSFFATKSVTTPRTSPPSDAASLIRLELTKK
jgi:hypothetical protein